MSKTCITESRIKWRSACAGLCSTAAISSPGDFVFTNVSHCGTYEACSKWQGIKNKMCFRYTSLFRLVRQLVFVGGRTHLFLHIATYTVSFPFIMIILALKLDSLIHMFRVKAKKAHQTHSLLSRVCR